ncbi:hypothetical protein F5887DRAFT_917957 [Amanita rubescens]|nr:hypothetical protein F5887DRAFT_917957 [Amanita rubescens]
MPYELTLAVQVARRGGLEEPRNWWKEHPIGPTIRSNRSPVSYMSGTFPSQKVGSAEEKSTLLSSIQLLRDVIVPFTPTGVARGVSGHTGQRRMACGRDISPFFIRCGVLFHGPPGTGKTLMARVLAASCRSNGKQLFPCEKVQTVCQTGSARQNVN